MAVQPNAQQHKIHLLDVILHHNSQGKDLSLTFYAMEVQPTAPQHKTHQLHAIYTNNA